MKPGHLSRRKDLRALPRDALVAIAMSILTRIDEAGMQQLFDEIALAIREAKS